jgi:pimeloyl-ACP methyl ester carboxylesterase
VIAGPIGAFYSVAAVLAHPAASGFLHGVASFATCVLMDRRGIGWSDPLPAQREPSLEHQAEDLEAVLDHAGVERAILWAAGFDAQPVLWFAARHPERTAGVVALATTPMLVRSDDHPSGIDPYVITRWLDALDPSTRTANPLDLFGMVFPTHLDDRDLKGWFERMGRHATSPATARRYVEAAASFDVREDVSEITAPMLVLHGREDRFIDVAEARLLADLAPHAELYEREGSEHAMFAGDSQGVIDAIERFVTGRAGRRRRVRVRTGWEALTPAERRVAELVTAGRSNPEIAAALYVSIETVKTHVKAAFLKMGARSRVDLARRVTAETSGRAL